MLHLLALFPGLVLVQVQQVDDGLAQQLVHAHQRAVHDYNVQGTALGVPAVEERQVEGGFFLPRRLHALLRHRGGKFVLGHLDDGVRVVRTIFPFDAQVARLKHRHLDAGRVPLLALLS